MNQKTTSLPLTKQEANALIKILDLSVKSVGISDGGKVAQNATYFFNKISTAFKEETVQKEEIKS